MPSPSPATSSRPRARKTAAASLSLSISRSPTPRHGGGAGAGPGASPSSTAVLLLSVEELRQTPDSRLLSYLMDSYNAVRAITLRPLLSAMSSPSLTVAAAAVPSTRYQSSPFTPAYVEELLTPRLLFSAIPHASQLVACLLCDAVRLHHQHQQQERSAEKDSMHSPSNTSGSTAPPPSPRSALESQQTVENDIAAGVAPLPFPSARCADVLRCISGIFAELFPSSSASTSSQIAAALPLKRASHLIERAAVSHIFRYLLPHCAMPSEDTQHALQPIFDAVRCASVVNSNATTAAAMGSADGRHSHPRVSDPSVSAATCNEMAQLLTDLLVATRDITAAQLTPLLEELAGASAALRFLSRTWSSTGGRGGGSTGIVATITPSKDVVGSLHPSQLQGGALIAARVLLEQTDVALQPAIAAWVFDEFDGGVQELLMADAVQDESDVDGEGSDDGDALRGVEEKEQQQRARDGRVSVPSKGKDAQLSRRCRGLRKVARVLEVLVALTELSVDLVDQVLPILSPHLEHPNADLRLLLLRGFGAVYAAHDAAVPTYASIFSGPFLSRFLDVRPNIRMEALRLSSSLLAQCAVRSGAHDPHTLHGGHRASDECSSCVAQQERLWKAFQPCWDRLLTDPHVLVRKQAVCSVIEAASVCPLMFQQQEQRQRASAFLEQTLGLRTRDKNKRVRDAAVEGLPRLYHAYRLTWVPNVVLDALRVEAGRASLSTSAAASTSTGDRSEAGPLSAATLAETVVESLLPSPSATSLPSSGGASVSGKQSTLSRWMGSGTAAAAPFSASSVSPSRGSQQPALLKFEQTDGNDAPRTSAEESGERDEGDVLLGLGPAAATERPSAAATTVNARSRTSGSRPARSLESAATATYVDGLVHLCQSVDAPHFTQLLRLAEKKPQLRLAVQRLFEFHAAVRASNGDVKSAEGQQRINAIHRLLRFLQETTGAQKGEWDALFRSRDDTVRKALLRVCDSSHLDWIDARDALMLSLQGRVGADVCAFVKNSLVPQLLLPIRREHLHELMRRLHRCIYVSDRAEVVVDTPEAVAVLRALLFLTAGSPSYCTLTAAGLAEALQASAKQSTAPPPVWCALLLQALQQWATAAAAAAEASPGSSSRPKELGFTTPEQRDALVNALRSMALASLPMQQVATNKEGSVRTAAAPGSSSPLASLKQLAKQSTRTLLALLQVPGFDKCAASALQSLVAELTHQLVRRRALTNDVKTVAWLASVQALAAHQNTSAAVRVAAVSGHASAAGAVTPSSPTPGVDEAQLPPLLPCLGALLLAAVSDVSDTAEQAKLTKPQSTTAPATSDNHEEVMMPASLSLHPQSLTSTMSVAAAIVDGAAKAMTRLALSCPTADGVRATAVSYVLENLLQGYKATAGLSCNRAGPYSIGSCHRRLALEKQLVKLLAVPSPDIAKEMAAAVVLSVEEDAQVREAVQTRLASLLLQRSCDMRVAALLLLTAISEDTKNSYHRLRSLVESVGDRLREKQASQGVSLSSPAALYCYWEYAIPFVVLFLAHHPHYTTGEAETQFLSFQRVWHLLVVELFRKGTQCAGFVVELLSRIKQSDDALDPSSNATRVMCDLGSRVLLECLGQRQSRAEDLRRYPGAVLLPSFFVKTAQPSPQKLLETVYLSDSVRVAPNAPFRLASAVPVGGAVAALSGSRGGSRQAIPRAPSLTAAEGAAAETEGLSDVHPQLQQQRTPPTQRKRPRSPSVKVVEDSPAVSLSPSVAPRELSEPAAASQPLTDSGLSSPSKRERTEPALADSSETPMSSSANAAAAAAADEEEAVKRETFQKDAVNAALAELFTGLTKAQIAQLRWKLVRARLEEALQQAEADFEAAKHPQRRQEFAVHSTVTKLPTVVTAESNLETLLQYAKDQLRVWYNDAPA
ncbi:hypothetical protein ABL78_3738 [Leptomonas seymouri]|uniref:Sister chromatid cohesion protein n=1 Tax=Leptomonas seymouri TaxID=5684 RepID=A0A0N0P636_LEPSE|nr:hypothetical protein ABL78_3738 [Leptomonas seymouri]|eukprot:KPI87176.1 hypothetical protein ABL78_3738 [Leptomonas seymouri]